MGNDHGKLHVRRATVFFLTALFAGTVLAAALPRAGVLPHSDAAPAGGAETLRIYGFADDIDRGKSPPRLGFDGAIDGAGDILRAEPAFLHGSSSAYDSLLQGSNSELVMLNVTYHPTLWFPATSGFRVTEPGSNTSGLFDVASSNPLNGVDVTGDGTADSNTTVANVLNYRMIFDEEIDPSLDTNNAANVIDLLGPANNVSDYRYRNTDISNGNADYYFPALNFTYLIVPLDSNHNATTVGANQTFYFPFGDCGDEPGIDCHGVLGSDRRVFLESVLAANPNEAVRLQTDTVTLKEGEILQFLDHAVELVSVSGSNDRPTAVLQTYYAGSKELGPIESTQTIEPATTGGAAALDVLQAGRFTVATATIKSGDIHTTTPWYVEVTSASLGSKAVQMRAGRILGDTPATRVVAVDGALYMLTDLTVSGTSLVSLQMSQYVPLGEDVTFSGPALTIEGLEPGATAWLLPPFHRDHQVLKDHGVPTDDDTYGFFKPVNGTSNVPILPGDLDLASSAEDPEDRAADVGPLDVKWAVQGIETRLNTKRAVYESSSWSDVAGDDGWETIVNHVFPQRFVELDVGPGMWLVTPSLLTTRQLPGYGLFWYTPGDAPGFLTADGAILLGGSNLTREDGDVLYLNPLYTRGTHSQIVGSFVTRGRTMSLVTTPEFRFDPYFLFEDRDADAGADLNPLTDEDHSTTLDTATTKQVVDKDVDDNLFDLQTKPAAGVAFQNNDQNEGDVYGPALLYDQSAVYVNADTNSPTTLESSLGYGLTGDAFIGTSSTKLMGLYSSCNDVGDGLDAGDANCDGRPDLITASDIALPFHEHGIRSKVITESFQLAPGQRAQYYEYEYELTSVTSADDSRASIKVYHAAASPPEAIASELTGLSANDIVQVDHNYRTAEPNAVNVTNTATHCSSGPCYLDRFLLIEKVNAASGSDPGGITARVGTYTQANGNTSANADYGNTYFIDHHMYQIPPGGSATVTTTVNTVLGIFRHVIPLGKDVRLTNPSLVLKAIQPGDALPLGAPYDQYHERLDVINPELETDRYGFLAPASAADGDETAQSTAERVRISPAIQIVFEGKVTDARPFAVVLSSDAARRTAGNQIVNGYFCNPFGPNGSPGATFDDRPDAEVADTTISVLDAAWTGCTSPADRGFNEFVKLRVTPGTEYLLNSTRLAASCATGAGCGSVSFVEPQTPATAASTRGWFSGYAGPAPSLYAGTGRPEDVTRSDVQERAPPKLLASDLTVRPATPEVGRAAAVSLNVTNVGETTITTMLALVVDGTPVSSQSVTVAPAQRKAVQFSWTPARAGPHDVRVWNLQATVDVAAVASPVRLVVESVTAAPTTVEAGDAVTLTIAVKNDGEAGTALIEILDGGVTLGSVDVALDAGASKNVAFTYIPSQVGERTLTVGERTLTVTVTEPQGPSDDDLSDIERRLGEQREENERIREALDEMAERPRGVPGFGILAALGAAAAVAGRRKP